MSDRRTSRTNPKSSKRRRSRQQPAAAAPAIAPDRLPDSAWRREAVWAAGIVLFALVLRLIYTFQYRSCPLWDAEIMDPLYHHQWAQAFVQGESFMPGPYFRAPLYPWFLGVIYWLFGDGPLAPRLVQALLGSLSCGLLFLIGRQTFGRIAGIVAGLAGATYWVLLYFDTQLLIVVLIVFLDLLLLWWLLRTQDRPGAWRWLLSGFLLGLSALARPNILLFAPALAVWVLVLHRPRWRRGLAYTACLAAGTLVPILPITIRNYVVGQDLVLISSQAGVNFYIGNNPETHGMTAVVPGTSPEWWDGYYEAIARAEQAVGKPLRPSEVSSYYTSEAFRFMREQPGQAARLMLSKLRLFWSRWEIANNQDLYFITERFTPLVKWLPLGFWIVGPLGGLGLLLCFRRWRELLPLWGFTIVYMGSVVAFFVPARYRVPVVVVLIVLGAHAACWIVNAVRAAKWQSLSLAAVALALFAIPVSHAPGGRTAATAQTCVDIGVAYGKQGQPAKAEELFNEGIELWSGQAKAWFSRGHLRAALGRHANARADFERALALDADFPGVRNNLAAMLWELGEYDDALRQFALAVQADPEDGMAQANLGHRLVLRGHLERGRHHLLLGLDADAETAEGLLATARWLIRQQQLPAAVNLLQDGLKRRPDHPPMLIALSTLLAAAPDPAIRNPAEAVRAARRACELTDHRDLTAVRALVGALLADGQKAEGIATLQQAINLARQIGQAEEAARLEAFLRQHQSGPPAQP